MEKLRTDNGVDSNKILIRKDILLRNGFSAAFLSYVLIFLIWGSGILKIFALPLALLFLIQNIKASIVGVAIGILCVLIYFFSHGYEGPQDLKATLVLFHFVVPAAVCHWAIESRNISTRHIAVFIFAFLLVSVVFVRSDIILNGLDDSVDRYRGFILPLLLVLLVSQHQGSRLQLLIIIAFTASSIFLISGSRGATLLAFGSLLAIWLRTNISLIIIPITQISLPLLTLLYQYFFPEHSNNIVVRASSSRIVMESLTPFGNGMAPPVREFHQQHDFGSFFVPADVQYFGGIYEMGYIIFFIKFSFVVYLALHYWRRSDRLVVSLICSYSLFGYNLTHDAFELAASAILFRYLPIRRKSLATK